MVDAHDQEFAGDVGKDAKRRQCPTADVGAGLQSRHGAIELLCREPIDRLLDVCVELRGRSRTPVVEVGEGADDIGESLFRVGSLQRPSAAWIISRARSASTTRPWRYDSSTASIPASSSGDN